MLTLLINQHENYIHYKDLSDILKLI